MSLHDWKFHCAVLGIPEHSSPKEIKEAYRKLAQKLHPDHNDGTIQAKEKFQGLSSSYRYLIKNFASRPVLQREQESPRQASAPPPVQPLRWGWRKVKLPKHENPLPALLGILCTLKKPSSRPYLIGACVLLFLSISLSVVFRGLDELTPSTSARGEAEPEIQDPTRDKFGRKLGRCELYSFDKGNLIEKMKVELSEVDCELECLGWNSKHDEYDANCAWAGKEFAQHTANPAMRALATPTTPPPPPQVARTEETKIEFRINGLPENEHNYPVERKKMRLSQEYVENLGFTPVVWIENAQLIHGKAGLNSRQVIITPIRKGVSGVAFTDANDRPLKVIIFDIE